MVAWRWQSNEIVKNIRERPDMNVSTGSVVELWSMHSLNVFLLKLFASKFQSINLIRSQKLYTSISADSYDLHIMTKIKPLVSYNTIYHTATLNIQCPCVLYSCVFCGITIIDSCPSSQISNWIKNILPIY